MNSFPNRRKYLSSMGCFPWSTFGPARRIGRKRCRELIRTPIMKSTCDIAGATAKTRVRYGCWLYRFSHNVQRNPLLCTENSRNFLLKNRVQAYNAHEEAEPLFAVEAFTIPLKHLPA